MDKEMLQKFLEEMSNYHKNDPSPMEVSFKDENLQEKIARILYYSSYGVYPSEYEALFDKKLKKWKTSMPWDTCESELKEWERDDYRFQAKIVLNFLSWIQE